MKKGEEEGGGENYYFFEFSGYLCEKSLYSLF
jgi:hypothetical protein